MANSHRLSDGDQQSRKGRVGLIAVVVLVVAAVLAGLAWFLGGQRDEAVESSPAPQESVQQSDSSPSSPPESEVFVDEEGQQEHEYEPAPGEFPSMEAMSLTVGGETAPIDPVQVTDQGVLLPPHDVSRLGWYSASAVPGAPGDVGSSVITGHINYQGQGTGFAQRFTTLRLGDEVSVGIDGQERRFRVTEAPYRLAKGEELPQVVNDAAGQNRLVLITCGGKFVGGALGYEDNIIVVADPIPAA